ncbi:hypothetical protein ACTFIR_011100 [Dictyostelium discoideum]
MINKSNSFSILFVIFLKIVFVVSAPLCPNSTVLLNYNVPTVYNSSEGCGMNNEPICTSLKDAVNRAFLLLPNNSRVCIGIIGNINVTSEQIALGNYCGALWITSENINTENNNYTIIDGSSSTQPFLTCEPEEENNQTQSCLRPFSFQYINFTNWDIPIVSVANQISDNSEKQSSLIYFVYCNIISSRSIAFIYNHRSLRIGFTNTKVFNLKPSTILAPNSPTDFISPIYVMGGEISFNLSLFDSVLEATPFIYIEKGSFVYYTESTVENCNFSENPFMFLINSSLDFAGYSNFSNTIMSTFLFISQFPQTTERDLYRCIFFKNVSSPLNYQRKSYLGYQLENSSITIKNSSGKTFGIANYLTNKFNPNVSVHCLFFAEESSFEIKYSSLFPIQVDHILIAINSSVSLQDAVGGQSNMFPVIGNNSDVNLSEKSTKLNNIYCGCEECKYFLIYGYHFIPIANHTCIDPTPTPTPTTPTPTPTTTITTSTTSTTLASTTSTTTTSTTPTTSAGTTSTTSAATTSTTITSTALSSSLSSTSTTTGPIDSKTRNIIILTVILGTASIASLIIFSLIYKMYKDRRFISHTSSTEKSSFDSNLYAVAEEDEKAVSPTIDLALVAYEHQFEDYAEYD